jgi:hypothetical protein
MTYFDTINSNFKRECNIRTNYVPKRNTVKFRPTQKCDGCEGIQLRHTHELYTASGTQSLPDFDFLRSYSMQGYVRRSYEDL